MIQCRNNITPIYNSQVSHSLKHAAVVNGLSMYMLSLRRVEHDWTLSETHITCDCLFNNSLLPVFQITSFPGTENGEFAQRKSSLYWGKLYTSASFSAKCTCPFLKQCFQPWGWDPTWGQNELTSQTRLGTTGLDTCRTCPLLLHLSRSFFLSV